MAMMMMMVVSAVFFVEASLVVMVRFFMMMRMPVQILANHFDARPEYPPAGIPERLDFPAVQIELTQFFHKLVFIDPNRASPPNSCLR